jgi:hypothetical protein
VRNSAQHGRSNHFNLESVLCVFFVNMSSPIQTFASEIGLTEKFKSNQHQVDFDQTSENLAQILLEIITRYSMQDSPHDE